MADTRNKPAVLKQQRQDAMREQLQAYGLISQVIDTIKKVEDAAGIMESNELAAHKFVTESRLKLINKYLPDLKNVEVEGNIDTGITVRVLDLSGNNEPTA